MAPFYDARGNIYAVISPQALRALGVELPDSAVQAALTRHSWSARAVSAICDWPEGQRPAGSKSHRSDGLLVGPFQDAAPFDVLIVNTDGTLAERSGNGLSIFAQSLSDTGRAPGDKGFTLRVHHDNHDSESPVPTEVVPGEIDGVTGFWLDIGTRVSALARLAPRGPACVGRCLRRCGSAASSAWPSCTPTGTPACSCASAILTA